MIKIQKKNNKIKLKTSNRIANNVKSNKIIIKSIILEYNY